MNPERLLKHFEAISEADDAVPRLRQVILDLAIRGKLVEQLTSDQPTEALLKQIENAKNRLVKAGEIPKQKAFDQTDANAMAFDVPATWKWVPIRSVTTDRGQKVPKRKFSYIDVSAIDKERGEIASPQILAPNAAPSRARKIVQKGDVIYSCVRPYLLNIAIIDRDFEPEPIVSTAFAVLNGLGYVLPRYLWIVLRSPYFVGCVEKKMRGQAYPAINDGDFAPLPIPLPPLAEQGRIVAKVDELMALCDELEAARTERETRRDRLVAATLHRLNNGNASPAAGNSIDFRQTARFYFNHLPRLTSRVEHVRQLRQVILNRAICGRLIQQDDRDEPTPTLMAEIKRGRERIIDGLALRRQPSLSDDEKMVLPFDVPTSWKTSRIDDCFVVTGGIQKTPKRTPKRNAFPYVGVGNVYRGRLELTELKEFELNKGELEKLRLEPEDLLIVEGNGSASEIGRWGVSEFLCVRRFETFSH